MATRLPTATRDAKTAAAVGRLDGAVGGPGYINIYDGVQPADPNTAAADNVLVTIVLAAPAYGPSTGGTAALAGTPRSGTGTAAAGTGTAAGWFRAFNGDDVSVFDGSVTGTGGGGELELDSVSIAEGQTVNINSLSYTQPAE